MNELEQKTFDVCKEFVESIKLGTQMTMDYFPSNHLFIKIYDGTESIGFIAIREGFLPEIITDNKDFRRYLRERSLFYNR